MSVCCCSLAGTNACKTCRFGTDGITVSTPYLAPKPKTNAGRIRSMSDEELAEFIYDKNEEGSREAWLEWLRKECEDG